MRVCLNPKNHVADTVENRPRERVRAYLRFRLTGDLSLYVTLQFGGIATLLMLLVASRRGDDPFPWWWIVGWYALAKLVEAADQPIWEATNGAIAGHALKHLAAAAAGAATFRPLRAGAR